jgi:hypothetical protein
MLLRMALIALAAGALLSPLSAQTQSRIALKSVSVSLPYGSSKFPGGHEADAVNRNCLICHSAGMVLTQPALSREQWQAEVDKMRAAYKAPIDPKDVDAIVGYLATLKN